MNLLKSFSCSVFSFTLLEKKKKSIIQYWKVVSGKCLKKKKSNFAAVCFLYPQCFLLLRHQLCTLQLSNSPTSQLLFLLSYEQFFLTCSTRFYGKKRGVLCHSKQLQISSLKVQICVCISRFLVWWQDSASIFVNQHLLCYKCPCMMLCIKCNYCFFSFKSCRWKKLIGGSVCAFFSCLFFKWISVIDILSYYDFFLKGIKILMYPSSHLPGDIYYKCIGL